MKIRETWNRFRKSPLLVAGAAVLAVVTAAAVITAGISSALYRQEKRVEGGPTRITVSADLADTLDVWESKVTRSVTDGSYAFVAPQELVHNNSYILMPGVDVPKDTFVRVTGKTSLDAYLYIEVVGAADPAVTFTVGSDWTPVSGVTAPHSGTVYVYGNGTKINTANFGASKDVAVLADNQIHVGMALAHGSGASASAMTVYAYMAQAVQGKTPAQVFGSAGFTAAP